MVLKVDTIETSLRPNIQQELCIYTQGNYFHAYEECEKRILQRALLYRLFIGLIRLQVHLS